MSRVPCKQSYAEFVGSCTGSRNFYLRANTCLQIPTNKNKQCVRPAAIMQDISCMNYYPIYVISCLLIKVSHETSSRGEPFSYPICLSESIDKQASCRQGCLQLHTHKIPMSFHSAQIVRGAHFQLPSTCRKYHKIVGQWELGQNDQPLKLI